MSAPSTPCTPPPGHWPSAATRCSRSRSRRCAGSVSAPGGSARSPPPPSSCSTTSTAAPHDQQAREAATGNGSVFDGVLVENRLCAVEQLLIDEWFMSSVVPFTVPPQVADVRAVAEDVV